MAAEEWQTVVRRKKDKPHAKCKQLPAKPISSRRVDDDPPLDESRMLALKQELLLDLSRMRSSCASLCTRVMEYALHDVEDSADLICLGIGRFATSTTARLQLILAMHLKETMRPSQALIYDPFFTSQEMDICRHFGFELTVENLYGKYEIQRKTVFFMPHCPYRLYCNVLWKNRDRLRDLSIIGNSFLSYSLRRISIENEKEDKTDLLRILAEYVEEYEVYDSSDCVRREGIWVHMEHAFNDLRQE